MSLRVPVYQPSISVTLYKTIRRASIGPGAPVSDRFRGSAGKIDVTPFLAEGSSVRTTKSVDEAAGGFSIFLADKPNDDANGSDSLYGLIEPMDVVVIRMQRDPTAGAPPIVMRGFVSTVNRAEGMTPDGKPVRGVSIDGQDYGKIWQMLQILYLPGYVVGQDTLTGFKLFERFGVGFQTSMGAGDFVREAFDKIINPYLGRLMPANTPMPSAIGLDMTVAHGTTNVSGPQNQEGTIYDLLRRYNDVGIWNELFLEDREEGVFCVFRPTPYKTVAGAMIQDGAAPETIDVPGDAISSLSVGRSDANVANYYWVRSPAFELASDIYRKQFSVGAERDTVLLGAYPNSNEDLYGVRLMAVDTQMGGDDVTTFNSGLPESAHKTRDTSQANWINDRRAILVAQNKDNVVFERGTARVRGDPRLRAGCYARFLRGQFEAEYYVRQVSHEYIPYQGFFSTLSLDRGRGFIERAKRGGGGASPYYAERS